MSSRFQGTTVLASLRRISTIAVLGWIALTGISMIASDVAIAQETSAQIVGRVAGNDGNALSGATVTITHVPSGSKSSFETNSEGQFSAPGLRVGGPYRIEISAEGFETGAVDAAFVSLGDPLTLQITLKSSELQEVVVSGTRSREQTIGAGATFTAQDIAELPSIGRDIKDLLRTDSRVFIDPTNQNAISIAGTNSRYNSLLVDGIRQGDDFGLNNNGYPSARSPISLDAIASFSVKIAPFDAVYSGFTGGQISIVTKSGTNDWRATAFYNQNSDSWVGNKSKDRRLTFAFAETNFGATLGGPILQDKLFFFLSYEKTNRDSPVDVGFAGSGFPVEVAAITTADVNLVTQTARTLYGYDVGGLSRTNVEDDEKILAKLDWNILDGHRASLTYQRNRGVDVIQPNSSASLRRVSLESNWYNRPQALDQITLQIDSSWTDALSTEFRAGRKEVDSPQDPFLGKGFGEVQITTAGGGTIYIGPDQSRHANVLTNDLNTLRFQGSYLAGKHTFKAGVNLEQLEVFNQFVPNSLGQYFFSSIADFQARNARLFVYNNATSNNSNDGAATFGYDTLSFYVQDKVAVTPTFTALYGIRLDKYSSGDRPVANANFFARYGFSNTETYDGRELIQPRLGFEWELFDRTKLRGGVGVFGGGTPNVWISNSYSTDGVSIVQQTIPRPASGPLTAIQAAALNNVNPAVIPAAVLAAQGAIRGDGPVSALAPSFDIPSSWKYNLNFEQKFDLGRFGEDYTFTTDVIYTKVRDAVLWKDLRLVATGSAPDGRPIYTQRAGTLAGNDLLLTNTDGGKGLVLTFSLEKKFRTVAGAFDAGLTYGYQDIEEVNPGTSSTALSNWDNVAVADPNNPALATANTEIKHVGTLRLTWSKALFADYDTSAGLFVLRRAGLPYSYTFGAGTATLFGDPRQAARQRGLLYVPRDANDVLLAGGLTQAQLDQYIASNGLERYRGSIAPRNAFNSPWVTTADLRLSQQFPVWGGVRGAVVLDVVNLTNLINNNWGRLEQVSFPYVTPVLDASIDPITRKYIYRPVAGQTGPVAPLKSISALPSVWRMQLGVRFEF